MTKKSLKSHRLTLIHLQQITHIQRVLPKLDNLRTPPNIAQLIRIAIKTINMTIMMMISSSQIHIIKSNNNHSSNKYMRIRIQK